MTAAVKAAKGPPITADQLVLAVVLATAQRREQLKRRNRSKPFVDDCLDALRRPELSPNVLRYRPSGFDPTDVARRELVAEALRMLERIAPVARVMAED